MIVQSYILFARIPIIKNSHGRMFTDPLWAKDLKLHLGYISDFGICCPVVRRSSCEGLEDITDIGIKRVFELQVDGGLKSVLKNFLPNFNGVRAACKHARIVHSDGAGWAFPLSFYLLLLRPFMPFYWIIVVESSFWMLGCNERKTLRKVIEHYVHKLLLTRCVKRADARVFTQEFYREYFLGDEKGRTIVSPATWVDEANIVTPDHVRSRFRRKTAEAVKILFPSRLVMDKGVLTVLAAIEALQATAVNVNITIMGYGALAEECQRFANSSCGGINVEFREAVDYGATFFETLAEYDWVLIPTLKQEQPRIVFDAFSQGVPVIASDTCGIHDVTNKDNAFIFEAGNPASLVEVISHVAGDRALALRMGLAGLDYATGKTHLRMHQDRAIFLEEGLKQPRRCPRSALRL